MIGRHRRAPSAGQRSEPLAVWLLLIVMNVDGISWADLGEWRTRRFFYHDPRRIAAATTLLLMLMAGVALFCFSRRVASGRGRTTDRFRPPTSVWASATATRRPLWSVRGIAGTDFCSALRLE